MNHDIILKNIHTSAIFITDLGEKEVPFNGTLDVGVIYPFELIVDSLDIKSLINTDKIIVNNGTEDLSKAGSLEAVAFATNHNVVVVSTVIQELHNQSQLKKMFTVQDKDYVEISASVYNSVITTPFEGTNEAQPSLMKIIASVSGGNSVCECRIFDITNSIEIASIQWSNESKLIYTTSLSNLSATEAIWEVQIKSISGPKNPRLHYIGVE